MNPLPAREEYADAIEIPDIHYNDQQEEPLLASTGTHSNDEDIVDLCPPTQQQQSRFNRFKQHLSKRNIKKLVYTWRWPLFFFGISMFMGLLMYTYRVQVFQGLETLSHKLSDMGYR
jgi:hypothetical protein